MNSFGFAERVLGNRAIPITQFARQLQNIDAVVDACSTAYAVGKYAGVALGTSLMWTAGLNAGGNTVIYSPLSLATRAVQEGVPLGNTQIGGLLNFVDKYVYEVPRSVWYAASGTYVANASGQVPAVIESVGKIVAFEMKILNWLNVPISRVAP